MNKQRTNRISNGTSLRSLGAKAVAAALFLGAASAPAFASETAAAPIEIQSCSTVYAATPEQVYAMGTLAPAGIEISYVNRAAVAAQDVTFRLGDGSDALLVVDHGNFAPGALIQHTFWTGSIPVDSCRVAAIRFVGGTAFDAPGAQTAANR